MKNHVNFSLGQDVEYYDTHVFFDELSDSNDCMPMLLHKEQTTVVGYDV